MSVRRTWERRGFVISDHRQEAVGNNPSGAKWCPSDATSPRAYQCMSVCPHVWHAITSDGRVCSKIDSHVSMSVWMVMPCVLHASCEHMWQVCDVVLTNKSPAVNGSEYVFLLSLTATSSTGRAPSSTAHPHGHSRSLGHTSHARNSHANTRQLSVSQLSSATHQADPFTAA